MPTDKPTYTQGDLFMKHRPTCRCKCCHRLLTDPVSVARNVGPACWAKGGAERWQYFMDIEQGQERA